MSSFDYLHPQHVHALRRLFEVLLRWRLRRAGAGLVLAALAVGGCWAVQNQRLSQARVLETVARARYERSCKAVQKTGVFYTRVRALASMDARVAAISESGDVQSERLEEIAAALPAHVWITALRPDSSGMMLSGDARTLSDVGRLFATIQDMRELRNPQLARVALQNEPGDSAIAYALHLETVAQ